MADSGRAIFLSYAREDAPAARRVVEALRASGAEVWFDENELGGGDAWDLKIRKQIKECALFVPIISANTQARLEGYFRLEWRLAEQRTHLMAKGRPFLLPVVIDETRDAEAHVPDSFTEVQWTRLPAGQPTPTLVAHIQRLLGIGTPPTEAAAPVVSPRHAFAPASSATEKSVAVLAFANLSNDRDNEYFSDGVSEELLNVLAKVPGLKVSARTSAFYFKGKEVPIPEIARQLGVAYVVEGSVRKSGDRVRITAQLIKAADGFHMWSDTFTRDLKDIFAVQDEIAGLVAQQLQLKLGSAGPECTVDPAALDLLLEARHHWNQRGEQNFDRAEALLTRALAIAPTFARAHSALADVWLMRATYRLLDGGANVAAELENLRASATRATELDPSLVDPVAGRAYGLMLENRMRESGKLFADALGRSPDNPSFLYWRGLYRMNQGDLHGARSDYEKAQLYDPMAFIIWHNSAECSLALGAYAEAARQAARANEVRAGGFMQSVACQAMASWLAGWREEALALARSTRRGELRQLRWVKAAYAIWVLRQAGFDAEAEAYGAEEWPMLPVHSYQRGFLLASLGRFVEAYPYLESMPPYIYYELATSVLFDPCRDDPRFEALIGKLRWSDAYAKARAARLESPEARKP